MTNFLRDENDVLRIGEDIFLDLATLHCVVKKETIIHLFFCSACTAVQSANEEDATEIFEFLLKEKSDYEHRRKLSAKAAAKRHSLAVVTQSKMLEEMKK